MKIVILGNGEIEDRNLIHNNIKAEDIVICCDGGLNYAFEEGILPKCIIGDFDSVSPQVLKFFESQGIPIKKFPAEKDFTDMELCLEFSINLLKEINAEEILILGGLGSRFDHSLANANILIKAAQSNVKASLLNEKNRIYLINSEIELEGNENDIVSLLPLSEKVEKVTTEGLYYQLKDYDLTYGVSYGVSNVMTGKKAKVTVEKGFLFVILAKD